MLYVIIKVTTYLNEEGKVNAHVHSTGSDWKAMNDELRRCNPISNDDARVDYRMVELSDLEDDKDEYLTSKQASEIVTKKRKELYKSLQTEIVDCIHYNADNILNSLSYVVTAYTMSQLGDDVFQALVEWIKSLGYTVDTSKMSGSKTVLDIKW